MKQLYLLSLFTLLSVSSLLAQTDNLNGNVSKFKIEVVETEEEVRLRCTRGCDWKELSLELPAGQFRTINEEGTIGPREVAASQNGEGFVIVLMRTDYGLEYEGLEGTAWYGLSHATTPMATIDQNGVDTQAGARR